MTGFLRQWVNTLGSWKEATKRDQRHLYTQKAQSHPKGGTALRARRWGTFLQFDGQQPRSGAARSDLTAVPGGGALRGLLIAGALATPVWVALYLLLR
jgi:hypothetical protein